MHKRAVSQSNYVACSTNACDGEAPRPLPKLLFKKSCLLYRTYKEYKQKKEARQKQNNNNNNFFCLWYVLVPIFALLLALVLLILGLVVMPMLYVESHVSK